MDNKYSYPWKKFHSAALALAGPGAQRRRLIDAALSLHTLKVKELPSDQQVWFDEFWDKITQIKDDQLGSVNATISKMSDQEIDSCAMEIMYAYDQITRHKTP